MHRFLAVATGSALLIRAAAAQEQPAEKVYKNIQVLKGVPASTFMNTMFFQRYSLGVSCSYCHVGTDWDKDDKPQKLAARRMLKMVFDINKAHFDGRPIVNCMTCHQGAVKPIGDVVAKRPSLQEMIGPRPQPRPAPALPSLDDVLTRYMAAVGGRDAVAKIANRVMKGNMMTTDGAIVPFEDTQTLSPPSSLSIIRFGFALGDFITIFDGTSGWNSDNRGVTEQLGEARAQLEMNAKFENPLALPELYTGLSVTGMEAVGGTPAIVVSGVSAITRRRERLYFDATSGLLLRRSVLTESVFGAFTNDTYFENYRTIDGVRVPTMISDFSPDFGTIRKAVTLEHNVTIDRSVFARPPVRGGRGGTL